LVSSYLELLRGLVVERRDLARCLTACRICGIEMLTHPRNAKRCDIGCVFGCRRADRARRSTARSVAYNRTPEGKRKKCSLNRARLPVTQKSSSTPSVSPVAVPPGTPLKPVFPAVIRYLCVVVGLIERCHVESAEIISILRQHRIVFGRVFVHDRPP
jgi:hypothetical protein